MFQISEAGLTLEKKWEGIEDGDPTTVNIDAYMCPAGYWTIGWGHVVRAPGTGIMLSGFSNRQLAYSVYPVGLTMEECAFLLRDDNRHFEALVNGLIPLGSNEHPTEQCQFDAMTCLSFNIGDRNFRTSSVLKYHLAGDKENAAKAFLMWDKYTDPRSGKHVESAGLKNRRVDEMNLYSGA